MSDDAPSRHPKFFSREGYAERFARGDSYGLLLALLIGLYILIAAESHRNLWGRFIISCVLGGVLLLAFHTSHVRSRAFKVDELRWSLVILVAFVLLALLSSVMAVFPKFKIHPEPGDELPPGFSPFFFGHFSQITKARHVELMADVLRDGSTTYRVMVEDIYSQGYYMLKSKYRYLRFSYACFLIGFVAASIQLTITVIVS